MKAHCLGFGCGQRDFCAYYADPPIDVQPVARICTDRRDGFSETHPIRLIRPAGTWESGGVRTPSARTYSKAPAHG